MTVHKLTAGDGYTYLTRQVAKHDASDRGFSNLGEYYSAKGEAPGIWIGSGPAAVSDFPINEFVSEANMLALFGLGQHPDAVAIENAMRADGASEDAIRAATRFGAPFRVYDGSREFNQRCASAYSAYNLARQLPSRTPVPDDDRSRIRTQIARAMFVEEFGREPADERELHGHLARISRQRTTAVAGYDLTFSPVKSVSTLWAIAPREVAEVIEQAHHDAVQDTLSWLERNAAYTRVGFRAVAQVETRGLIAAAFTHRDSRSGDPDLHTHVAISNKVQTLSGRWLALDGRPIYKNNVPASERYNTRLEALLVDRLGVRFADRSGEDPAKRPVREIVGVDGDLPRAWSSRRAAIDTKQAELAAQFQRDHGRPPTAKESVALAQQANLESRERKHEPRSYAEQRATWRAEAIGILGGETQLDRYISRALRGRGTRRETPPALTRRWIEQTADTVIAIVSCERATWQQNHVRAEAERQARSSGIRLRDLDAAVDAVVAEALSPAHSVSLNSDDGIVEPALLRRSDGSSIYTVAGSTLYTSAAVLAAEHAIFEAAARRDGRIADPLDVEAQLAGSAASGVRLNPAQEHLVRSLATSGSRVQLALAPAGTGKTTAMRVLSRTWTANGGSVVGLAPSAAAAAALRDEIGADTDTLAKLTWHLSEPRRAPTWMQRIGPDSLVIIDEAGMAGTADLAAAIEYTLARGGSVRLVGDDRQLAAIGAGGVLRDIAQTHGAVTLSQVMRFTDRETGAPNRAEGAASLALREGDASAIAFYLDHGRVHVGDLTTCTDGVFEAWSDDRAQGLDSIMLAPTRDLVRALNERAQDQRIGSGEVDPHRHIRTDDGLRVCTGDTIISRRNDRTIPVTATDWVRNGDRWRVDQVLESGSLTVTHLRTSRRITLPYDYVRKHVSLGYASTVHGAQGITADTCHAIGSGDESRQVLYVALTRGRYSNNVRLVAAGTGDPHSVITRDALLPPSAGDLLARILARDDAPVSATSAQRQSSEPVTRLQAAADRYHHAVSAAAEDILGNDGLAVIDDAANRVIPGLTQCDAYPNLRGHLALLIVDGHDPADLLIHAAAASRGLADARDVAAVLDWRLDPTGHRSAGAGPVEWLPSIPDALKDEPGWARYLADRARLVETLADQVAVTTRAWTPSTAPAWARPLVGRDEGLLADLAVFRVANAVPDDELRPTGSALPGAAEARAQRALDRRAARILGDPHASSTRWAGVAERVDPRITTDPYWPSLATQLTAAERAGLAVASLVERAVGEGPLPDEQPAAALWWRLSAHIAPAAVDGQDRSDPLRPEWTPALAEALGPQAAARVVADPAWPTLVAAVNQAGNDGWSAHQAIDTAHQLLAGGQPDDEPLTESELATALAWRITMLSEQGRGGAGADRLPNDVTVEAPESAHDCDEDWLASLPEPGPDRAEPATSMNWVAGGEELGALYAYPGPSSVTRQRLVQLNEMAATFYENEYIGSWAATYLAERVGLDLRADVRFRLGYAPDCWDALTRHLREQDVTDDEIIASGLGVRGRTGLLRDRFRDRLLFPITADGPGGIEVHGFIGRRNPAMTDDDNAGPKYLNTAETDLFCKGHEMYGLADQRAALDAGARPVLVEGPVDAIAVTLAGGGRYVGVAPLGTAFTDVQADKLRPYRERTVIVATDADDAGQRAAYRDFWQLAARGHNPQRLLVADGKDPAELLQTAGAAKLLAQLDSATNLGEAVIAMRIAPFADRLDTVEGRVYALRRAAEVVVALPPDEWRKRADELAARLGVSHDLVIREIVDATTAWSNDPFDTAKSHASEPVQVSPKPATADRDPINRWAELATRVSPDLTKDPDWPVLAESMSRAASEGFNVETRLALLTVDKPLDKRHAARDLQSRLVDAWASCAPQSTSRHDWPDEASSESRRRSPTPTAAARSADGGSTEAQEVASRQRPRAHAVEHRRDLGPSRGR